MAQWVEGSDLESRALYPHFRRTKPFMENNVVIKPFIQMAEFNSTLTFIQRLLRQGPTKPGQAGQGLLLGPS